MGYHASAVGVSPSGKARGFDLRIPRFESWHPSHIGVETSGGILMAFDDLTVFTGNANPELAREVVGHLGVGLGRALVSTFSDGEVNVEIMEHVRASDVFVIQPICAPASKHLMELLVMIDALKRSSAERVTAVMPYYGYARQDRRPRTARVAITAKLVADMIGVAGADRVANMDLHADQILSPIHNCRCRRYPTSRSRGESGSVKYHSHTIR